MARIIRELKWKKLSETQDTTLLLANRINHPNRDMQELFAQSLFDTIFADGISGDKNVDDAMYKENDGEASESLEILEYKKFFF